VAATAAQESTETVPTSTASEDTPKIPTTDENSVHIQSWQRILLFPPPSCPNPTVRCFLRFSQPDMCCLGYGRIRLDAQGAER